MTRHDRSSLTRPRFTLFALALPLVIGLGACDMIKVQGVVRTTTVEDFTGDLASFGS